MGGGAGEGQLGIGREGLMQDLKEWWMLISGGRACWAQGAESAEALRGVSMAEEGEAGALVAGA